MEQKIIGIVGAIAGLAAIDSAQAAAPAVSDATSLPSAKSYAELLDPIPNALATLRAADAAALSGQSRDEAAADTGVRVAQYHHHHHHHHHHRFFRHHHHHHHLYRWRYHHHHHHHHRRYY